MALIKALSVCILVPASGNQGADAASTSTRGLRGSSRALTESNPASCHDAVEGEMCYNHAAWAHREGIHSHPEWYPGLTNESSFADVQAHFNLCYWNRCPRPCASTSQVSCIVPEHSDGCYDSVAGEKCHDDAIWAKEYAINTRPEWYPGLTNESSFADFQAHLHYCYWNRCPRPCAPTVQTDCRMPGRFWDSGKCADAQPKSECYIEVDWAMTKGIELHPEWYPSLNANSSFREFQARLFQGERDGNEQNVCPEPCCHDTVPGELCYGEVDWAMKYGSNLEDIRHVYPALLTNESGFAEFQAYLHLCYPQRCPKPCKTTVIQETYHADELNCPDVGYVR